MMSNLVNSASSHTDALLHMYLDSRTHFMTVM